MVEAGANTIGVTDATACRTGDVGTVAIPNTGGTVPNTMGPLENGDAPRGCVNGAVVVAVTTGAMTAGAVVVVTTGDAVVGKTGEVLPLVTPNRLVGASGGFGAARVCGFIGLGKNECGSSDGAGAGERVTGADVTVVVAVNGGITVAVMVWGAVADTV